LVVATFVLGATTAETRLRAAISHLEDLLAMCLEHPVNVKANVVTSFPAQAGKRRPIRCDVKAL
jgi:phenylacetate-CoA ligase